jgi:uncharacterized membrane protein
MVELKVNFQDKVPYFAVVCRLYIISQYKITSCTEYKCDIFVKGGRMFRNR